MRKIDVIFDLKQINKKIIEVKKKLKNRTICPLCRQQFDLTYILAELDMLKLKLEYKLLMKKKVILKKSIQTELKIRG